MLYVAAMKAIYAFALLSSIAGCHDTTDETSAVESELTVDPPIIGGGGGPGTDEVHCGDNATKNVNAGYKSTDVTIQGCLVRDPATGALRARASVTASGKPINVSWNYFHLGVGMTDQTTGETVVTHRRRSRRPTATSRCRCMPATATW